jgi:hypothetical protein
VKFSPTSREEKLRIGVKAVLASLAKPGNPLSELVDLLGYEQTIKFLFVFGGRLLSIPPLSALVNAVPAASAAIDVVENECLIPTAAIRHGVPPDTVDTAVSVLRQYLSVEGYRSAEKMKILRKVNL